jgi:hypothetical protein
VTPTHHRRERVWSPGTTSLTYRLNNLREALYLLLELLGPSIDDLAVGKSAPRSAQAATRWLAELIMAARWASWATCRLRNEIDCPELIALDGIRGRLITRAAARLVRRGQEVEAGHLLALVNLTNLTGGRLPC